MKKTLYILCAAAVFGFWASNANAVALTQTGGAGTAVTVPTTAMTQAPDVNFNPSTGVAMNGASDITSFAISAYHTSTLNKASGQAYGMAADVNKLFFQDISGAGASAPSFTGTTSAVFGTGWNTM